MAKYLTRRCIGLHALTLVLVSSFILAAWWQYESALGGNGLSWAYVFEWPAFAVYAVYMWWRLIHDKRTAFDRLWAAKQHAAADAFGTPLYQIPGWALDKTLYREVVATSLEVAASRELSVGQAGALAPPELGDGQRVEEPFSGRTQADESEENGLVESAGRMIDAQAIDVKVHADEELIAYNRYLAELNSRDSPKHWGPRWRWGHKGASKQRGTAPAGGSAEGRRIELAVGDRDTPAQSEFDVR